MGLLGLMWNTSTVVLTAFRLLLSGQAASNWGWIMWFTAAGCPGHLYPGAAPPDICISSRTLTGSNVAENASCRAQQANLHISSVNTGPTVTNTYLERDAEQPWTDYTENKLRFIF